MMLQRYHKNFVRPPHPEAKHLRCLARLDNDISEVLPYLNTSLRGHQYFPETPIFDLKIPGPLDHPVCPGNTYQYCEGYRGGRLYFNLATGSY